MADHVKNKLSYISQIGRDILEPSILVQKKCLRRERQPRSWPSCREPFVAMLSVCQKTNGAISYKVGQEEMKCCSSKFVCLVFGMSLLKLLL